METNELPPLRAENARKLSDEKKINITEVLKCVYSACGHGNTLTKFFDVEFSVDLIKEVIDLGYSIHQFTDMNNQLVTKISW